MLSRLRFIMHQSIHMLPSVIGGFVGALVIGVPLVAYSIWREGHFASYEPDPAEMAAVMSKIHQGQIGRVEGPYGLVMTMGMGRTPGVTDLLDSQWFWQRLDGLDPKGCGQMAREALKRVDLHSVFIGDMRVRDSDAIRDACEAHPSIAIIHSMGEIL